MPTSAARHDPVLRRVTLSLVGSPTALQNGAMTIVSIDSVRQLRSQRSSVKYTRYEADVLPLSVAEMDYPVAEPITEAIVARVLASDFGYIDGPGKLADAFSAFASTRWDWTVNPASVRIAADVSVGIVETLRYGIRRGAGVVITPPVYPPFYELIDEAEATRVEVPLVESELGWCIDLVALERAFADGAEAFLLCNPHNPLGLVHDRATLIRIAELAALYDVLVISDEVHAPLTHPGHDFTPFASIGPAAGARSICVTSASKGWNLAGTKCALLAAGDARSLAVLDSFPEEVACRTSILGLHANIAAFDCTQWLEQTIGRVVANDRLLSELLERHLPAVRYHRPAASYLGWLDLTALGLGDDPAEWILTNARVALNSGPTYGASGHGHARINLACDPETLLEAVLRIADALEQATPGPIS